MFETVTVIVIISLLISIVLIVYQIVKDDLGKWR